ncbi:hypothetical protein TSAR_006129 [Trichomalopsis sarcophagae]|uniref:Uncharacterized protein n=1 Tax=Trichomalopsis sarcophagae TaxID=543379 RepID=A0A232EJK6_9HYME|nr:hypothetical protein TSAR_006129 [Trichomalopsis sarcophagae]
MSVEHFAAHRGGQLVRVSGVREHVRYRTIVITSLNFFLSSILLLGPTDDCLDCSRQYQADRSQSKMSVKSAVLKQLEEKCALLTSRMERASRLIQQHRNTYAKLYEDCEEEVHADVHQVHTDEDSMKEGEVKEDNSDAERNETQEADKKEETQQQHQQQQQQAVDADMHQVHAAEDAAMDIVKKDEIDVGEEFLEYFSPASPDTAYDSGEIVNIEPGHEEESVLIAKLTLTVYKVLLIKKKYILEAYKILAQVVRRFTGTLKTRVRSYLTYLRQGMHK